MMCAKIYVSKKTFSISPSTVYIFVGSQSADIGSHSVASPRRLFNFFTAVVCRDDQDNSADYLQFIVARDVRARLAASPTPIHTAKLRLVLSNSIRHAASSVVRYARDLEEKKV